MASIYCLPKDLIRWFLIQYVEPVDYLQLLLTAKLFHCLTVDERSNMYYRCLIDIKRKKNMRDLFYYQYQYRIFKRHGELKKQFDELVLQERRISKYNNPLSYAEVTAKLKIVTGQVDQLISEMQPKFSFCQQCHSFIVKERFNSHFASCKGITKKCKICYATHWSKDCCQYLKDTEISCTKCKYVGTLYEFWQHKHKKNKKVMKN